MQNVDLNLDQNQVNYSKNYYQAGFHTTKLFGGLDIFKYLLL